jgi:G8 domain
MAAALSFLLFFFPAGVLSQTPLPTLPPFTIEGNIPGDTGGAQKAKLTVSNVPDFADSPTVQTAADGFWSQSATWIGGTVPVAGDVVRVDHFVVYDVAPGAGAVQLKRVAISAGGRLAFNPLQDTEMHVDTLYVAENGTLEVGSVQTPVAGSNTATIRFSDEAVNSDGSDPHEWGHGMVVLGDVTMVGEVPVPVMRMAGDVPTAGATTFSAHLPAGSASPVGSWRTGDRLLVPDTRQLSLNKRNALEYNNTLSYGAVDHQLIISSVSAAAGRSGRHARRSRFSPRPPGHEEQQQRVRRHTLWGAYVHPGCRQPATKCAHLIRQPRQLPAGHC